MTNILKSTALVIAGLAVGWLVSVATNKAPAPIDFGGVYNQVQQSFDQAGFHVGPSGTNIMGIKATGCTINSYSNTIAASSSVVVSCGGATNGVISSASAIAGITTDSICSVVPSPTVSAVFGGISVDGALASTTLSGTIDVRLLNNTGNTFTWSSTASSSGKWKLICIDPL